MGVLERVIWTRRDGFSLKVFQGFVHFPYLEELGVLRVEARYE